MVPKYGERWQLHPLEYFVPPPPPPKVMGVKINEITCLWLTDYIDYKNQFLAAPPLNVEIAVIAPSYVIF